MKRVIFPAMAMVVFVGVSDVSGQSRSQSEPGVANDTMVGRSLIDKVIAIRFADVPLGDALDSIAERSGMKLSVSKSLLPAKHRVTIEARRGTVRTALQQALAGSGFGFELAGSTIVIVKLDASSPQSSEVRGRVVGRVTDTKTQAGVPNAEVGLDRTRWWTTTDSTGWFRLTGVDSGTYQLVARRIGYTKARESVQVTAGEDTADIALDPRAVALDELVTTATGYHRRRDIGNGITTIRADSVLRSAPIHSLTDLLEDRVPGMTVRHTSGAPGDPARLRLRGLGSIMRSNDPVVIVDGVRVYGTQAAQRSGNLTNLGTARDAGGNLVSSGTVPAPSPLDQIDPNIIETIEVFKGPSAATLYGADAANGVIVITTKKGRPGPTRWSASVTHGRTKTLGAYSSGYYRWGHDEFNNIPRFCTVSDLGCVQDSLIRFQALNDPNLTPLGEGRRTGVSLTASGGTQAMTYSVTGTYSDELGLLKMPEFEVDRFRTSFNRDAPDWMRRPHGMEQWSVTSSATARLSQTAEVTLSTALSRTEQRRSSLENQLAALAGTYVDTMNGIYLRPGGRRLVIRVPNILEGYYKRTTASALNFTTGLNASWRPRSWFNASGQTGLNVIPRTDELLLPAGLVAAGDSGAIVRGTGRSLVSTANIQASVRAPLRWGFMFETSVGANLTSTSTSDLVASASRLVPGTSTLTGAQSFSVVESQLAASVFGWYIEPRITGQRFSLSTGMRLDGGSTYGTRLSGLIGLPKLNGSWVISEEPFFPFKSLFSSLRLRGAYGQAQVQPGAADRLRLYDQSVALTTLGNTMLRPERSTEFEGGFDADLLDSRFSVELTAYRKTQVDALMPVTLPNSVNGGGQVLKNVGTIRNTGMEVTARVTPVQLRAITWSMDLKYSRNRNVLVELGRGVEPNPRQGLVAGYPVGGRWARPILGFADVNDDGVLTLGEIQIGDDPVFVGRLYPDYMSSLYSTVLLFGGTVGITTGFSYESGATQVDGTAPGNWVLARALVDPSTPLSEQAAVVAADGDFLAESGYRTNYGVMQAISTFRFKSLSMNYRAPARLARWLGAEELAIAVQGANLALNSSYRGKDPDVSAWSPGEGITDTGQLPLPRTWQLRIDLQY